MIRINLNIAIVSMINARPKDNVSLTSECLVENKYSNISQAVAHLNDVHRNYTLLSNLSLAENKTWTNSTENGLPQNATIKQIIANLFKFESRKFDWNEKQQGSILGSFFLVALVYPTSWGYTGSKIWDENCLRIVQFLWCTVLFSYSLLCLQKFLVLNCCKSDPRIITLRRGSSGYWLKLNDKKMLEGYNGEYFQQHEGTAMGNSLSPFIANLFMSKFETEVKDKFEYFPRVWFRYVDDIFAVFDTKAISLDNFVAKLNNRFPTIKFTYEVEHNEQLPFLDVLVIRNSENKLEFDVYRKETATLRYIPNDSHHHFQHKMASFNFLIHRLLNFPLSKERFEREKQLIKNIAKSNGYSVHLIDKLIRKHKFKRTLYNSTTFRRDTDNSKFASLPYEPKFTHGLDKIFKNININLVYNSKNKLQTLLGNPKDKINNNEKSGIYEISCKDCDKSIWGKQKDLY
ncbi:hypothetical protein NQ318_010643 [Aromia moschata]|uniref:Helix-turn-helix domain-containing protein n=1 Tax=Aromia moschata TaxID=1265417 RepID=A0AAV8XM23_9CUCU|nr:hypothetical protein NQ318_010643 [Aromia moschata]